MALYSQRHNSSLLKVEERFLNLHLVGMSNRTLNVAQPVLAWRRLVAAVLSTTLISANFSTPPALGETNTYCQLSTAAAQEKENFRVASLKGNKEAKGRYEELLKQHSQQVRECRSRTWPETQAIWLRLYPCDLQPGAIDQIMDRLVNRGYNQVYVETFYNGQVLLPQSANPTVWPSVILTPGAENVDLLAQAIQKGRERGLKVYAWMFTTNFGYSYAQRPDRQAAIARNGKGQTSLYVAGNSTQLFIDPYNLTAKRDYYQMVQEVLRRRPDGILFDYIRYPRQGGSDSIATKVTDLWLYSEATQKALFARALNKKGLELIRRFLSKGFISSRDIDDVDRLYPQEGEPMWQGRPEPPHGRPLPTAAERQPRLQWELWQLSVAHAMQGILDFVALASWAAKQKGIPAGVVFFPEGNQTIGQGYDSRLQPWDRFPKSLQWHPMSYAACGTARCIGSQVQRVTSMAKSGTQIIPAIAGTWGASTNNRPSLELQMQEIRRVAPQIRGVSHFAYSWQDPDHDSGRKFCRAQ
jgi:hypothetical protein